MTPYIPLIINDNKSLDEMSGSMELVFTEIEDYTKIPIEVYNDWCRIYHMDKNPNNSHFNMLNVKTKTKLKDHIKNYSYINFAGNGRR